MLAQHAKNAKAKHGTLMLEKVPVRATSQGGELHHGHCCIGGDGIPLR
jgi:hypothetical protein